MRISVYVGCVLSCIRVRLTRSRPSAQADDERTVRQSEPEVYSSTPWHVDRSATGKKGLTILHAFANSSLLAIISNSMRPRTHGCDAYLGSMKLPHFAGYPFRRREWFRSLVWPAVRQPASGHASVLVCGPLQRATCLSLGTRRTGRNSPEEALVQTSTLLLRSPAMDCKLIPRINVFVFRAFPNPPSHQGQMSTKSMWAQTLGPSAMALLDGCKFFWLPCRLACRLERVRVTAASKAPRESTLTEPQSTPKARPST